MLKSIPTDTEDVSEGTTDRPCPLCGEGLVYRHCKYVCPCHGVAYDCADTFW